MEITQEDFERVVEVVYRQGVVRDRSLFVSSDEIRETITDVYDFLKYDLNASQSIHAPDTKQPLPYCSHCGSHHYQGANISYKR